MKAKLPRLSRRLSLTSENGGGNDKEESKGMIWKKKVMIWKKRNDEGGALKGLGFLSCPWKWASRL